MNAYVLRVDPMMDIFMQFLLVENTSLAETRVVKVGPVRLQNRCCRNQKKLDYEIETYHVNVSIEFDCICRNQKKLDYEIET